MNDAQDKAKEPQGFEQSTHDFYYRTWMRLGRPKPFDEWMKDREDSYSSSVELPADYSSKEGF